MPCPHPHCHTSQSSGCHQVCPYILPTQAPARPGQGPGEHCVSVLNGTAGWAAGPFHHTQEHGVPATPTLQPTMLATILGAPCLVAQWVCLGAQSMGVAGRRRFKPPWQRFLQLGQKGARGPGAGWGEGGGKNVKVSRSGGPGKGFQGQGWCWGSGAVGQAGGAEANNVKVSRSAKNVKVSRSGQMPGEVGGPAPRPTSRVGGAL